MLKQLVNNITINVIAIIAQFFVHGRRSGVVALQNAMFPEKWLSIRDGKVTVVNSLSLSPVVIVCAN